MKITDYSEVVMIMMKRKRISLREVAEHIGTSSVYARQVIDGMQRGEKAVFYRAEIAEYLGIKLESVKIKQGV